jgi:hypothetical protein
LPSRVAVERKGHLVLPYSSYRFGLYLDLLVGLNLLAVGDLRGRRTTIMEIGAGWGGFAAVVKRKFREARYIILDIPSSSVFQMSLLHQLGFKRIFSLKTDGGDARRREQLQQLLCCTDFDILFLSPSQFGLLPDNSVDVTVNFDSLAEMSRETINLYVQNISRVSQVFYTINRRRGSTMLLGPAIKQHMRWQEANSSWSRKYSAPNRLMWKPNNRTSFDVANAKGEHYFYVQEVFVRRAVV